jgi:hypothetical protein
MRISLLTAVVGVVVGGLGVGASLAHAGTTTTVAANYSYDSPATVVQRAYGSPVRQTRSSGPGSVRLHQQRASVSLVGLARGAAEEGGAIARDFSFGDPGAGALGSTDRFGNITIRPGLSDQDFAETLRHETVHSVLSPSWGPLADARMWLYSKSSAYRYAEEALAEGYAVRSVGRGLTFPIANGYVSPLGLGLEFGGLGAAGYGTYEAAK